MQSVTVLAPAKLNLALDVTGILPNGYHALDMVMQAVSVFESVTVSRADTLSLVMPGSSVPADEHNIAIKAARAFFGYTGLNAGACISIEKHTPVQAGMGGGSADAAGVLAALNALYADCLPRPLSLSELLAIGAPLGADVPFALMGGTCRVKGVGDYLCPLPPVKHCAFVIVMPGYGVSTPAAFKAFDAVENPFHPDTAAVAQAVRAGDLAGICAAAGNALEAVGGAPETPEIRNELLETGAMTALMTGSGAAVFGVYETLAHAERAAALLRENHTAVYVAEPVACGPMVVCQKGVFPHEA